MNETKKKHHQHNRPYFRGKSSYSLGKSYCKTQINLPFPYPMLDLNKKIIWPFSKEEFFMIAIGHINDNEKLISIKHLPTIVALNKMGFFGAHSSREIIFKSMIESQQQQSKKILNKQKFTVGFFSLKTIDNIPKAMTNFSNDTNKLKLNSTKESNDNDNDNDKQQRQQKTSFNCMKLNFEEAFFLSYVFGMLKIEKNSNSTSSNTNKKEYYNLNELWIKFCQLYDPNDRRYFIIKFASYYYFRSKGFIVNNGFKFGVDYLLYEEGPPFNHSHYAVIVDYKFDNDQNQKQEINLKYNDISGLIRISNNSRKELLLCTVIIPNQYRQSTMIEQFNQPDCIKNFKINLIQLKRQTLDLWQIK